MASINGMRDGSVAGWVIDHRELKIEGRFQIYFFSIFPGTYTIADVEFDCNRFSTDRKSVLFNLDHSEDHKIPDTNQSIYDLASEIGLQLSQRQWLLVTAESCTGGWLGQAITAVAGSSQWYDRGFITYSNVAKQEMLGVQQSILEQHGAVSPQTAQHMALGALTRSHAHLSVSITGIAGPAGGSDAKPVGTVCFCWVTRTGLVQQQTLRFAGDRDAIRHQAVLTALQGIQRLLQASPATA